MGKKLTSGEFIKKSKEVHGYKYDYSLVNYKNYKTKIKIVCKDHGTFEQNPKCHLKGQGCYYCGIIKRSKSRLKPKSKFIDESNIIHNYKYDYSLVNYKNNKCKVKIICKNHGVFEQNVSLHLHGSGCPVCSGTMKSSTEDFIKKSNKIHDYKYDYSLVNYKNNKSKIKIICKEHGNYEQIPTDHLNGSGCPKCSNNIKSKKMKYDTIYFINKSKIVHNNKYDYSSTNYIDYISKIDITCPLHGNFKQVPHYHLRGNGCPKCSETKGEREIRYILEKNNIDFIYQKTFNECKLKRKLSFDFYLTDYNICIEYDGIQHFKPIDYFGGEKSLEKQKQKDLIKTNFCKNNNIDLIRIKYDDDIIERIYSILK